MVKRCLGLLLFMIIFGSCHAGPGTHKLDRARSSVTIQTASGPISFFVELAKTDEARARGLMFRFSLAENHGMLFLYDQDVDHPFWMKNTPISLDILFIDKEKRIVFIAQNTVPFSEDLIASTKPYRTALEINSGLAKRFQIKAGDRVTFDQNTSK